MDPESSVSVIITTFNNFSKLAEALNTVKNQTFKNIEIIVVDGKKNMQSAAISKRLGARYVWIEHDLGPPGGVQNARNIGANMATSKYVAFLDEDDIWTNDKIEKQYRALKNNSSTLVTCYTLNLLANGTSFVEKKKEKPSYEDLLKGFEVSPTSSFLMNREALGRIGAWDEEIRGMQEYDVALRLTRMGANITCVPEPLLIKHQDMSSQLGQMYWQIAGMFEFFRRYGQDVKKYLGIRGLFHSMIRMMTLLTFFVSGYVLKDRLWFIMNKLRGLRYE